MDAPTQEPAAGAPTVRASPGFADWLLEAGVSLAFTNYDVGKLFFVGVKPDGRLALFERSFPRCMGLGVGPDRTLWMASLFQLWRLDDFLDGRAAHDGHDALYVPTVGHTTGELDLHDVHVGADGRPVFVATRFNCLATLAERGSFRPLWRPPFIDGVVAEDRCHLNGLAMADGAPAFVTCVAGCNRRDGWRETRVGGGLLIDVATGETAASGLTMPHSPRLRDGAAWLLHSGTGEFCRVDLASGRVEPLCFLNGFARGLCFVGDHAAIGLSRPRRDGAFSGLPLEKRLAREGAAAVCAVVVVDLASGAIAHRIEFGDPVRELYDVVAIPGVRRPKAIGFKSDETRRLIRLA